MENHTLVIDTDIGLYSADKPSTPVANSLLNLPWVIRRAIWEALLGLKTIHVVLDAFVDHQSKVGRMFSSRPQDKTTGLYKPIKGSFFRIVCQADVSNEEAYERSRGATHDEDLNAKTYGDVRWARYRHRTCYVASEYVGSRERRNWEHHNHTALSQECTNRIFANILRACHQVYEETFTILYSSNTWSFKDLLTLSLNSPIASHLPTPPSSPPFIWTSIVPSPSKISHGIKTGLNHSITSLIPSTHLSPLSTSIFSEYFEIRTRWLMIQHGGLTMTVTGCCSARCWICVFWMSWED